MPEFLNTQFPTSVDYGTGGGPMHNTTVVRVQSGYEYRSPNWSEPLRVYEPIFGVRPQADLEEIIDLFLVAEGQRRTFRARDESDYKSCALGDDPAITDQTLLASAVGGETTTQIIKANTLASVTVSRDIVLPVSGTVLVGINGTPQVEGVDFDIDYTVPGGLIVWDATAYPSGLTASDTVTAGFQYDILARFASDEISVYWEDYKSGRAAISLIEVRL